MSLAVFFSWLQVAKCQAFSGLLKNDCWRASLKYQTSKLESSKPTKDRNDTTIFLHHPNILHHIANYIQHHKSHYMQISLINLHHTHKIAYPTCSYINIYYTLTTTHSTAFHIRDSPYSCSQHNSLYMHNNKIMLTPQPSTYKIILLCTHVITRHCCQNCTRCSRDRGKYCVSSSFRSYLIKNSISACACSVQKS